MQPLSITFYSSIVIGFVLWRTTLHCDLAFSAHSLHSKAFGIGCCIPDTIGERRPECVRHGVFAYGHHDSPLTRALYRCEDAFWTGMACTVRKGEWAALEEIAGRFDIWGSQGSWLETHRMVSLQGDSEEGLICDLAWGGGGGYSMMFRC